MNSNTSIFSRWRKVIRLSILILLLFALFSISLVSHWCATGATCAEKDQKMFSVLERERFEELMRNWPRDKPRGAIYILTDSIRVALLQAALRSIDRYFNKKYEYPVIIFHEGGAAEFLLNQLRIFTVSDLYLQRVDIKPPGNLRGVPETDSCSGLPIGYRNMCRFNALLVYKEPILDGLKYYWRLDTDSILTREVNFDVFQRLEEKNSTYGYIQITEDRGSCVENLWPMTRKYVMENSMNSTFLEKWTENKMFYNNFEVSRLDFWRSKNVQDYLSYLDETGGIYYHRWGDAPIKSLALAVFLDWDKIYTYQYDVGYNHKFTVITT